MTFPALTLLLPRILLLAYDLFIMVEQRSLRHYRAGVVEWDLPASAITRKCGVNLLRQFAPTEKWHSDLLG